MFALGLLCWFTFWFCVLGLVVGVLLVDCVWRVNSVDLIFLFLCIGGLIVFLLRLSVFVCSSYCCFLVFEVWLL